MPYYTVEKDKDNKNEISIILIDLKKYLNKHYSTRKIFKYQIATSNFQGIYNEINYYLCSRSMKHSLIILLEEKSSLYVQEMFILLILQRLIYHKN